jgi:low temperature requirement protein LtrA
MHLAVFPALAALGVGVQLAIEDASGVGDAGQAAAVLGLALAAYLIALTAIQRAAPRGLTVSALAGRLALAAGAALIAGVGGGLSPPLLVGLSAAAVLAQTVLERFA